MQTFVYASTKKANTYVWLAEKDCFDSLPPALVEKLGTLRLVINVELTPERELPREDVAHILEQLKQQGWYLQLPPHDDQAPAGA